MTASAAPKPASVAHNNWRSVDAPAAEEFLPSLPVSVVMPCYQTPPPTLARTLATLEGQSYPRHLFEVVVVDDGSDPPLRAPSSPLEVKVVRQERRGFGVARARNTGAEAAAHDILLFLDSDMLVEADWMAAHARWHHVVSDALTAGFRAHVAADDLSPDAIRNRRGTLQALLAGRPMDSPRMAGHLIRTANLTARADDLFRVIEGADFGIGKPFYRAIGGSDESFQRWGMEDIELAYRAFAHGALLTPIVGRSWHQSRDARGDKERSNRIARGKAAHLIAHPEFRSPTPGRHYSVPQHVVTIVCGDCPAERIVKAVADVLADRMGDLAVRVEWNGKDDERSAWLRDVFDPDPRVWPNPNQPALEQFPAAAYHIRLPAGVAAANIVWRLRAKLGGGVSATAVLAGGERVSIVRGWALHRARRAGREVSHFGEARTFRPSALRLRDPSGRRARRRALREAAGTSTKARFLALRWRDAHGWRETWWCLRWVVWWCTRRIAPRRRVRNAQRAPNA